jgi:hypothetical protein
MTEYNAANHDYSAIAGVPGAMFGTARWCFPGAASTPDLPAVGCTAILRSYGPD